MHDSCSTHARTHARTFVRCSLIISAVATASCASPEAKVINLTRQSQPATSAFSPQAAAAPIVELSWQDSSASGWTGAISRSASQPVLRALVHNTQAESSLVTVRALFDADGTQVTRLLPQLDLAPGERAVIDVDIGALSPVAPDALRFSASLVLLADGILDSGRTGSAGTEQLYFHVEGSDFLVYDETALQKTFGSGDFAARLHPSVLAPKVMRGPSGSPISVVVGRVSIGTIVPEEVARQTRTLREPRVDH